MRDSHAEIDARRSASGPERRRARPGAVEEPMVDKAEITKSTGPQDEPRFSRADFAEPLSPLFQRELAVPDDRESLEPALAGPALPAAR